MPAQVKISELSGAEKGTRKRLIKLREIQGYTAPFMCLGAAKFVALKLAGLIDETKHLNDFLSSPWAAAHKKSLPRTMLKNAWGWSASKYTPMFNDTVLPAAIADRSANVMKDDPFGLTPEARDSRAQVEFTYFTGQTSVADRLLFARVPLVVGVGIEGGRSRGHFVTMFCDANGGVWVIDPYSNDEAAVWKVALVSFATPIKLSSELDDRIPCEPPWFGYYRDKGVGLKAYPVGIGI
jgi:hypothetical protein